jgi:hypothetical protein
MSLGNLLLDEGGGQEWSLHVNGKGVGRCVLR